eukprot:gene20898-27748_t
MACPAGCCAQVRELLQEISKSPKRGRRKKKSPPPDIEYPSPPPPMTPSFTSPPPPPPPRPPALPSLPPPPPPNLFAVLDKPSPPPFVTPPPNPPRPPSPPRTGIPASDPDAFSFLYGRKGEYWSPRGRLLDYSFAGYGAGAELPVVPMDVNVMHFGAAGNGVVDDTAAFMAAIEAATSGAIYIPRGKYKISRQLVIQRSGIVLRGDGPDMTTLFFANSFTDLFGQTWSGGRNWDGEDNIAVQRSESYLQGGSSVVQDGVQDPPPDETLITRIILDTASPHVLTATSQAEHLVIKMYKMYITRSQMPPHSLVSTVKMPAQIYLPGGASVVEDEVQDPISDDTLITRIIRPESYLPGGSSVVQNGVKDPISDKTLITRVIRDAGKGDNMIFVDDVDRLRVGQRVTLVISDSYGSLVNDLNGGAESDQFCSACINAQRVLRFHSRITALDIFTGLLVMDRPLPYNIKTFWSPEIHSFNPGITDCGIEDMSIEFKWSAYENHLQDEGWNGIEFAGAADCWANNLRISNSDNAVIIWMSSFITVSNVWIGTTRKRAYYECHHAFNISYAQDVAVTDFWKRAYYECHHAFNVSYAQDVAVTDFWVDVRCHHDIAVYAWDVGVVFAQGGGMDLNLDHHRLVPYGTLFTAIMVGTSEPTRPFFSGGIREWGENQIGSTFWNLYAGPQGSVPFPELPADTFGTQCNFIGFHWFVDFSRGARKGWYREDVVTLRSQFITPANLYESMKSTRRERFQRSLAGYAT